MSLIFWIETFTYSQLLELKLQISDYLDLELYPSLIILVWSFICPWLFGSKTSHIPNYLDRKVHLFPITI